MGLRDSALAPSAGTGRWCVGMRFSCGRAIQPAERQALLRLARRARRTGLSVAATVPVAGVGGALALWMSVQPRWTHLQVHTLLVGIVAIALLVPLLALLARERLRAHRAAITDLDAGVIERYEGQLGSLQDLEGMQRRLLEVGLLEPDPRRVQRVDIAPASGVLLRVNGRPVHRRVRARIARVASPRPHGYATKLPGPLVRVESAAGLEVLRRSLSPDEMDELNRYGRRFRRRFWLTLGLGAVPAASGAVWSVAHVTTHPSVLLVAAGLGVAGITVASYMLWLRVTQRIEEDRELRWVITLRERSDHASQLEVLPVSQLVWTEEDRPASWRLSAS